MREVWGRSARWCWPRGRRKRFGALKQVLPWRGIPLVAHVADQALRCPDMDRVAVTVGAGAEQVRTALAGRARRHRPCARLGRGTEPERQSRIERVPLPAPRSTLHSRPSSSSWPISRAFRPELLSALIQRHRETLAPIVAPRHNGQRGNPVLFDAATFPEFAQLEGDIGARPIIQTHRDEIAWVDWPTPEILEDIDVAADYNSSAQG